MDDVARLRADYPWTRTPLVVSAPMRLIALADMAVEVSNAGKVLSISSSSRATQSRILIFILSLLLAPVSLFLYVRNFYPRIRLINS